MTKSHKEFGLYLKSNLSEHYFDIIQAAKEMGVSRQTIYRWINDGKLPTEKVGKQILIGKSDLYALEDERIVDLVRQNVERKLRHEAEQYHWESEEGIPNAELVELKENSYTFKLELANGTLRTIVIDIGQVIVDMNEDEPYINVEIKQLKIDGKMAGGEFPKMI